MKRLRWMSLVFPILVLAVPLLAQQAPAQARLPVTRPADPLTASEIDRVRGAATTVATQRFGTASRLELVSVELANVKLQPATRERRDFRAEEVGRHAIVTLFNYGTNEGLSVLMDLRSMQSVSANVVPSHAVPLSAAEIQRAATLARQNDIVRRSIGDASYIVEGMRGASENVIEGLRYVAPTASDPCAVERCVDLFFRRGGNYIVGLRVNVNLTRGTVNVTVDEEVRR